METGINITVGPGEFIDRLTILRLKLEHARAPGLREVIASHVAAYDDQRSRLAASPGFADLEDALSAINRKLWIAEDEVRRQDADRPADASLLEVARSIAAMNDQRARIKAEIDALFGWSTTETKLYGSG